MKKVININFQGRIIPIEESAYDMLKQYVESLRKFFANEEGRDEIINDIEGRIAELFGENLKKGSTCITDVEVNHIIKSMGRPEERSERTCSRAMPSALTQVERRDASRKAHDYLSGAGGGWRGPGPRLTAPNDRSRHLRRDDRHRRADRLYRFDRRQRKIILGALCF